MIKITLFNYQVLIKILSNIELDQFGQELDKQENM